MGVADPLLGEAPGPALTIAEEVASYRASGEDLLACLERFEALLARPSWHARARCRGYGPDAFFPSRRDDADAPKATCRGCPVRAECLAAGIGEREGVWGGLTPFERRQACRIAS